MTRNAPLDEYRADRLLEEGFTNRVGKTTIRREKENDERKPTDRLRASLEGENHARSPEMAPVGPESADSE